MRTHTVTTAEIRAAWSAIQAGRPAWTGNHDGFQHLLDDYRATEYREWFGCKPGTDIARWLAEGYWPEGESLPTPPAASESLMPIVALNEEEGDLLIEAVLSGEDMYYVQWEQFEARRGLHIEVCVDFNGGVQSGIIGEYVDWTLNLIDSVTRTGIAPSVSVFQIAKGTYAEVPGLDKVTIPLTAAGEIVDAVAWRAFFTKASLRSLGFVALALAGDKAGLTTRYGLGQAVGAGWRVDRDADTLTVHCDSNATRFDRAAMDASLAAAGGV